MEGKPPTREITLDVIINGPYDQLGNRPPLKSCRVCSILSHIFACHSQHNWKKYTEVLQIKLCRSTGPFNISFSINVELLMIIC